MMLYVHIGHKALYGLTVLSPVLGLWFAVMKDPANLAKHQANPKVAPVIAKMMNKFGGPKWKIFYYWGMMYVDDQVSVI